MVSEGGGEGEGVRSESISEPSRNGEVALWKKRVSKRRDKDSEEE